MGKENNIRANETGMTKVCERFQHQMFHFKSKTPYGKPKQKGVI